MMPTKYLSGLIADDFDIPGVYGIPHARVPGSWRIVCSYADGKRHKTRLFGNMEAAGQYERRRMWEFHHIVEGQHYADVDFAGQLARAYMDELPCVLIAKEEHMAYNRLLHIAETDELHREQGLPRDLQQRSAAAKAAALNRASHPQLRIRVDGLLRLYRSAYSGDHVLTRIAENVLRDALAHLG